MSKYLSNIQDERNEKEKLTSELIRKGKEWNRQEQALSLRYTKEINDWKQKVFVLETRLKDVNEKNKLSKTKNIKVTDRSRFCNYVPRSFYFVPRFTFREMDCVCMILS